MKSEFNVWFRDPRSIIQNLLSNPDFDNEFNYSPVQEYNMEGNHRFQDFMSSDWAWKQAVCCIFGFNDFIISLCFILPIQDIIAEDPETHGSMFIPVILGSDKTTVSVATGNNEYWPLSINWKHSQQCSLCTPQWSCVSGILSHPKKCV
jgi:Plavaka transposase